MVSQISTKQRIIHIIQEKTENINWSDPVVDKLCANSVSEILNVSRSVVSQYLNELNSIGEMVKVNTRPTVFLYKQSLVKNFQYLKNVYESLEELRVAIEEANKRSTSFTQLIGYNGSLSTIVQNCKSAITYPGTGLPILLLGPTGVGKSLIASIMFQYGVEKNIFGKNARFITLNCSEYANNPEFFLTNLFGCKKGAYTGADKDREGLVGLADGGLLFLDEVHCLSYECQEKLFLFMDKGIYHMVGDNDKWYQASTHLVFATTEDPHTALLKTLFRRIPIVTNVPALSVRPKQEKQELLLYFLEKEENVIDKEIEISDRLYRILVEYDFLENVGQMVNAVKACIANAYVKINRSDSNIIYLDIEDMPGYMMEESIKLGYFSVYQKNDFLKISDLKLEQKKERKLYAFNEALMVTWDTYKNDSFETLMTYSKHCFMRYLDSICFQEENHVNPKGFLYHNVIENTCVKLSKKYNLVFSNTDIMNLSKLFNDYVLNIAGCEGLLRTNIEKVNGFIRFFEENDCLYQSVIKDFTTSMKTMLNIEFNQLGILDMMIYLKKLSTEIKTRQTNCIILSHGYSTASSLAAAANHMLDDAVFDSIDMPMDVNVFTIAKKLSDYIDIQKNIRDLIILVDMGSLEEIYKRIDLKDNINVVIVNNVTIKLALDIGIMIKNNEPIYKIKESIDKRDYRQKSIMLENKRKDKAILSICNTGIAMAERICILLEKSFPRNLNIRLIPCSYKDICDVDKRNEILHNYDVQFTVGTMNPNCNEWTFISIEEMIEKQNIEKIKSIMGGILSDKELEQFAQNTIKNFSLENLLDYLTILNPEKIINYVEEIINYMQQALNHLFSGNIKVGLYLHISCLIERLITDRYITNYENIEMFQQDHGDFIKIVKEAFAKLERHYCVDIPVSEIAYIYDYIYSRPSVEKVRNSVEDFLE